MRLKYEFAMLSSMTGFGTATRIFQTARGSLELSAEIRTVNSKYLDCSIRSPRPYIQFDSEVSKLIRKRIKRGRVDVTIQMRVLEGPSKEIFVNLPQVRALKETFERLNADLGLPNEIRLSDLLKLPDWIESRDSQLDVHKEWEYLKATLDLALMQVFNSRLQEGRALLEAIEVHRDRFGETLEKFLRSHDSQLKDLRDRTRERVIQLFGNGADPVPVPVEAGEKESALGERGASAQVGTPRGEGLDPNRLEQEIVLWISRADFQEELDRIRHHLETFDTIVEAEGEVGRKLEFLVQELQREVNTLGSKCSDATMTPLVIELKTCIERIREQIQNIE